MSTKKKWTSPQFVVLARGTPDESVLTHCKFIGNFGSSLPNTTAQTGCDKGEANKNCGACLSRSGT